MFLEASKWGLMGLIKLINFKTNLELIGIFIISFVKGQECPSTCSDLLHY